VSSGTEILAEGYAARIANARRLANDGAPVVGLVGADIPRSLVTAAGAVPLRLFGAESPSARASENSTSEANAEAKELIGRAVDPATTDILRDVLDGEWDFLTGILVSHDCQASIMLFYSLRELSRAGSISIPVHLVDLVHLNREASLRFDIAQLRSAAGVLASWTGHDVTASSLRGAMTVTAQVGEELDRLQEIRRMRGAAIGGIDALHAYGVASALPPENAVALLRAVLAQLPEPTGDGADLRLFFTGSTPRGDKLYRAIEKHDAVIVGEDHDWGDLVLTVRPVIPAQGAGLEELFAALATALLRGAPAAPTSGQNARGHAVREAIAASGARALLSVVREQDEAAAWDFPHQSSEAGVAAVMVDRLPADLDATVEAQLADALSALRGAA